MNFKMCILDVVCLVNEKFRVLMKNSMFVFNVLKFLSLWRWNVYEFMFLLCNMKLMLLLKIFDMLDWWIGLILYGRG